MPTEHDRWEHLIPDYVSGRLSESDTEEVRRHVDGCAHCSRTVEELRPVLALLDEEKSRQASPQYFATVLPRIRTRLDEPSPRSRARPVVELVLPVASLALLLMIVLTIGSPWDESTPEHPALSGTINNLPADVIVEALVNQADQAEFIDGPAGGSLAGILSDQLLGSAIVNTLIEDQAVIGALDVSSEASTLWLSDLSEAEVTTLLTRLSERELL